MTARAIVIGLDGADLDLVRALGADQLPNLFALMREGAFGRLESVKPPATLPNWTTFLTGVDPGRHGVFDFTTRRGYRVAFTAGTIREAPTIAKRLDRLGLRCACIGFPGTWPPERLEHGVFISGWDSPVAFEGDRSFVWPPALYDTITKRFGPPRFDVADEFEAGTAGWHARLPNLLSESVAHKTELALHLLRDRAWDLFAFYFGESDTASHHLWSLWDERSPRHPLRTTPDERDGLARVYRALDASVGRIVDAAGPDAELTIVSDHGSGGSGDRVLYLNRALEELGWLTFRTAPSIGAGPIKDLALTLLPARVRQTLFMAAGRALPGWLESRARFGAIDFDRTRAFSEELNYFPSVCLNLEGREPRGQVRDRASALAELTEALRSLRDPWTGSSIVRDVVPREALYEAPHRDRAPDLVLDLALDDRGYSYNLMPSASAPPGTGAWRRLSPDEHLGRKGRSLAGSHRSHGLFIAHGPRVQPIGEIRARIADATATLLARLDVNPPPEFAGRVLREAVIRSRPTTVLPDAPIERVADGDRSLLERRLRALGYVD